MQNTMVFKNSVHFGYLIQLPTVNVLIITRAAFFSVSPKTNNFILMVFRAWTIEYISSPPGILFQGRKIRA